MPQTKLQGSLKEKIGFNISGPRLQESYTLTTFPFSDLVQREKKSAFYA